MKKEKILETIVGEFRKYKQLANMDLDNVIKYKSQDKLASLEYWQKAYEEDYFKLKAIKDLLIELGIDIRRICN